MSPNPTKNMTDKLRLDDITRRTIAGVEEDLEDLRNELADDLQDFEQRLRALSEDLPAWLELDGRTIRNAFRFLEDSPLPDGILGPRAVALAAADVEAFILNWFEPNASQASKNFELLDTRDEFTTASRDIQSFLDDVYKSSKILANHAHLSLEDLIDTVLYELETRRRTDVNALDSLVQEGELEPGRDAQKETAEIWEEQRLYVEQANAAFDPLMDLVDEGLALTQRGILELQELVARATQGRLGTAAEPASFTDASPIELDENLIIEQEYLVDTSYPDTEEPPEETHDTLPATELIASLAATTSSEQISGSESQTAQTLHDEYHHDTLDNFADDLFDDDSFTTLETIPDQLQIKAAESPIKPTSVEISAPDLTPDNLPEVEQSVLEQSLARDSHDPILDSEEKELGEIRAQCFRIRSGWHPIPRKELAAVLLPPTVSLVAIVGLCCLYLAGMLDDSPLRIWGWTRGAITASIGWLFVLPIMMNWYPGWQGWIPRFMRHYEDEENATALVDERRFSLERISCPLRDLKQVRVLRWESLRDRTRGWLLVIEPRYHAAVFLVTSEEDETLWFDSPLPRAEPPVDSWQLTPENFELLRERLEPSAAPQQVAPNA